MRLMKGFTSHFWSVQMQLNSDRIPEWDRPLWRNKGPAQSLSASESTDATICQKKAENNCKLICCANKQSQDAPKTLNMFCNCSYAFHPSINYLSIYLSINKLKGCYFKRLTQFSHGSDKFTPFKINKAVLLALHYIKKLSTL